ncbi:phage protease, partial [Cedecea sp. NFIX57]|uniref:phage protease n=1 Tax=Cedecea sp. NFIX57 TaxID=1566286 RepID=UPI000A0BBDF1
CLRLLAGVTLPAEHNSGTRPSMWKFATASLATIDKANTARVQLFPAGWFGPANGSQRWYLDAALAQTLIAAAASKVNAYLFDYEHQSLNAPDASGPVPAAGWFSTLVWVDGEGLYADVQWTARAAALIAADEYRYVSPTFGYDEQGCVRELINAALTNMPVLDGMRPVAAASLMFFDNGEKPMNENLRLALCAIFGLGDKGDENAILAAIAALQTGEMKTANCSSISAMIEAHKALLLQKDQAIQDGQTEIAALSVAAGNNKPDPTKYVPVAVVDDLRTKLAALSTQFQGDRVDKLLTAALSDGRVYQGADEDNLRELGKTDFALLEKMVAARQPVAALSRMQSQGLNLDDKGNATLSGDAMAICSQFAGLDEKAFAGELAKELNHGAD